MRGGGRERRGRTFWGSRNPIKPPGRAQLLTRKQTVRVVFLQPHSHRCPVGATLSPSKVSWPLVVFSPDSADEDSICTQA